MDKVNALDQDRQTTVNRTWLNIVGVVGAEGPSLTTKFFTISPQLVNSILGGRKVGGRNWLEEFHW